MVILCCLHFTKQIPIHSKLIKWKKRFKKIFCKVPLSIKVSLQVLWFLEYSKRENTNFCIPMITEEKLLTLKGTVVFYICVQLKTEIRGKPLRTLESTYATGAIYLPILNLWKSTVSIAQTVKMTDKREIDKKNIPPRRMTFSRAIVHLNYIFFLQN